MGLNRTEADGWMNERAVSPCSGEARIVEDEQAVFGPNATFLTNYILSDLDCDGDEPTLADCKKGFWRNTSCSGKSDEVGLTCLGVRMSTASAAPSATMSTTTLPPRICAPGNTCCTCAQHKPPFKDHFRECLKCRRE